MPDTMSFISDNQNVTIVGDNLAVEFTAAGPSDISIYLSGLNTHVTTMSSAGNTVIHEQGDYTTFTDLGGSLTIYGFAAKSICEPTLGSPVRMRLPMCNRTGTAAR
jgi:hypothetical protein